MTTGSLERFGRFLLHRSLHKSTGVEIWLASPADPRSDYPSEMALYRWANRPTSRGDRDSFATLLRRLKGTGVPGFIEAGEEDRGTPYLVCEYVTGISLGKMTTGVAIPVRVAVHIAGEVLRTLERLHAAGHAHGRVSAESVYITESGEVLLFGLRGAPRLGPAAAPSSPAEGAALRAVAPEVARGEAVTARADVYGVGILLLEMLLGRPWVDGPDLEILARAQSGDAARADLSAAAIPDGLRSEVLRALQASPAGRQADASDFGDNLFPYAAAKAKGELQALAATAVLGRVPTRPEGLKPAESMPLDEDEESTMRARVQPSFVTTRRGERVGPLSYAELVEKTVSGLFSAEDMVELMGTPAMPLGQSDELRRLLPSARVPTKRPQGFTPEQSASSLLAELAALYTSKSTAVLSVQRSKGTSADVRLLHLKEGVVTSVDTREPGDLLGEYLVSSGQLPRTIVDEALAALPKYKGQLGQALIGEGYASPLFVFRAIVMHLTLRFVTSAIWDDVFVAVENTTAVRPVLFPARLCVPQLMHDWLAGFEQTHGVILARTPNPSAELGPLGDPANFAHDLAHPMAIMVSVLATRKTWSEARAAAATMGVTEADANYAWHVLSLL